jgi:hypothetical protein
LKPTGASTYQLPSTIQSYAQWRTIQRNGVDMHLRERDVRIRWLESKIHIWREPGRRLWWMRCDCCLIRARGAFAVSRGFQATLQVAWRHAYTHHNIRI